MVRADFPTLREQQHPLICRLADVIEAIWRSQLITYAYDTPTDLGYVEGTLEGERLTIENHCYQTSRFRKLHLELAKVGKNLDILHCVMFPHGDVHLPIFGVDIVAGRGQISAAIVDLSPVSPERILPTPYREGLSNLPTLQFAQPRSLPVWGDIFSEFCLFVRPTTRQEEVMFFERVTQYLLMHCQLAGQAPLIESFEEQVAMRAGQRRYCLQQQQNDKTRRILEQAFGSEWADCYLQTMLFDYVQETPNEAIVMKHEVFSD